MLSTLELKDFAIVDELHLELAPGLNVLTGETGAGKSILIDALTLLIGHRADAGMIRAGCTSALVQGLFDKSPVESAARRLQAAGRSSARLDGELVTVSELAQRIGSLVAVHGQHAAQALAQPDEPRRRLDRLLSSEERDTLELYQRRFAELEGVSRSLRELRDGLRERERRRDTILSELQEIDSAELRSGEDVLLRQRSESLRHAERIVQNSGSALSALSGGERSALALLAGAVRDLENAARHHPGLVPLASELNDARAALQATGDEVESFLADFEVAPGELDRVEERLARIESLKRKYGDGVDEVITYRADVKAELERLESADLDSAELERREAVLEEEIASLGRLLSEARAAAGARLTQEVSHLLGQLGMSGARFEVRSETLPTPGRHGLERPRFAFGANPGEPLGDLSTVASGGELSRVMLALDVSTGSDRPVLVFDEVDAGIGGRTAREVGYLLKRLSREHQVLVVTHLPQVAAFADAQFFVEKLSKDARTVTRVHRLEPHEREQELARMLSGSVTDASLDNARELVAESRGA